MRYILRIYGVEWNDIYGFESSKSLEELRIDLMNAMKKGRDPRYPKASEFIWFGRILRINDNLDVVLLMTWDQYWNNISKKGVLEKIVLNSFEDSL